jgi:hypothetical protein
MDKPLFIPIDRMHQLPTGTSYVISYIEIHAERIAVRLVGLEEGAGREVSRSRIDLRDDVGTSYPLLVTMHGGQVVPEEVIFGFGSPLHNSISRLEVLLSKTGDVLEQIELGR